MRGAALRPAIYKRRFTAAECICLVTDVEVFARKREMPSTWLTVLHFICSLTNPGTGSNRGTPSSCQKKRLPFSPEKVPCGPPKGRRGMLYEAGRSGRSAA